MNIDNNVFLEQTQQCMKTVFDLSSKTIERSKSIEFSDVSYSKKLNIFYGYEELELQIIFMNKALPYFQSKSEDDIQVYYSCIDVNNLYANILGIILFYIRATNKLNYDSFKFDVLQPVDPESVISYNTLLEFVDNKESIFYLGFTFKN